MIDNRQQQTDSCWNAAEKAWNIESIYKAYWHRIRSYIYYMIGDISLADDLTQDVFVKVIKSLPSHQESLKLSAWLYRVATNTALDQLRRRNLTQFFSIESMQQSSNESGEDLIEPDRYRILSLPGFEDQIATSELVNAALSRMHPQYRKTLILDLVLGCSEEEISLILSIDRFSAHTYRYRAKQIFINLYLALEAGKEVRLKYKHRKKRGLS